MISDSFIKFIEYRGTKLFPLPTVHALPSVKSAVFYSSVVPNTIALLYDVCITGDSTFSFFSCDETSLLDVLGLD